MRSLLVFDGAMGSLLYERGIFVMQNFEQLNVTRPDVVAKIHEDYVTAGANIIETNTFGANSFRLDRHGLGDQVRAFNLAGARLARKAAGEDVWVAGSIGPTGLVPGVATQAELDLASATFAEQAAALVEGGADVLVLETFRHLEEIRIAIEAARHGAPDTPIIATMAFDPSETVADGSGPEHVATTLRDWGADGLGVNCGDGPQIALAIAERMRVVDLPLCVQPNAGLPRTVDGRLLYMATPEYFDVFARRTIQIGATMVGGCCGTTPEHVRWMAKSGRMLGDPRTDVWRARAVKTVEPVTVLEPTPLAERSAFAAKIAAGKFVVSVEVNPAPGLDPSKALAGAKMLLDSGVDIVNVADAPRAMARMSNIAFCSLLLGRYGIQPILHVCGRDRNLLAQMAHLLGAHVIGIRNLVIITGDPPKMGDYPAATAVFDLDSIGLLRLVDSLNHGADPAGKAMQDRTSFLLACGAEPAAHDYDRELRRLEEKKRSGAELIMTQPVYDAAVLRRFLLDTRSLGLPVLVGLCPLASARNAEFLHNEVPGMQIPAPIRERMARAATPEAGRREGMLIAREMLLQVKDDVVGAYVMPQFGRFRTAVEVLQPLGYDFAPEDSQESTR